MLIAWPIDNQHEDILFCTNTMVIAWPINNGQWSSESWTRGANSCCDAAHLQMLGGANNVQCTILICTRCWESGRPTMYKLYNTPDAGRPTRSQQKWPGYLENWPLHWLSAMHNAQCTMYNTQCECTNTILIGWSQVNRNTPDEIAELVGTQSSRKCIEIFTEIYWNIRWQFKFKSPCDLLAHTEMKRWFGDQISQAM